MDTTRTSWTDTNGAHRPPVTFVTVCKRNKTPILRYHRYQTWEWLSTITHGEKILQQTLYSMRGPQKGPVLAAGAGIQAHRHLPGPTLRHRPWPQYCWHSQLKHLMSTEQLWVQGLHLAATTASEGAAWSQIFWNCPWTKCLGWCRKTVLCFLPRSPGVLFYLCIPKQPKGILIKGEV